jgi:hypothetical protein
MFIEGTFSWDKEGERTSLEWPPFLSPGGAEAASRGRPDDDIVLAADPHVTPVALDARSIDGLGSAPFSTKDEEALDGPGETASDEWDAPVDRPETDQLDEAEDSEERGRLPRRRLSRSKGRLIVFGTAVTVALSGGYAAQAFGWRLPPKLRASAQPMRAFLLNLAPSRLVGFMATDRPARPFAADYHDGTGHERSGHERSGLTSDPAQPVPPAAASPVSPTGASSETEAPVAAVGLSQVADPGDRQAWVDRDAPDSEAVATAAALAAGEIGQTAASEDGRAATGSMAAPLGGMAPGPRSSDPVAVRAATHPAPLPTYRERPAPAWHGLVWSPSAQALVPAVRAAEPAVGTIQSGGLGLPASSALVRRP